MRKLIFITLSLLLALSLCGCGADTLKDSATINPTETEILSATLLPTLASTETVKSSPTVTEAPTLSPEEVEFNQQIQNFLNKKGNFTDEKIQEIVFGRALNGEEMNLGWFDPNPALEGVLLESHKVNDYILMEVGLLSETKERFVTVIGIPAYLFDGTNNMSLNLVRYNEQTGNTYLGDSKDENEILEKLKTLENKAIVFQFISKELIMSDEDKETCGETILRYMVEANNKIEIAKELGVSVWTNGFEGDNFGSSDEIGVIKIENIKNIYNLDFSDIPIVDLGSGFIFE